MPGISRKAVFDPSKISVVHCSNRFARQLCMMGDDLRTREAWGHRRAWMMEVEQILAREFAIEIQASATMDDHIDLVLRNRPDIAGSWSDEDVVRRWLRVSRLKTTGASMIEEPTVQRVRRELAKGTQRVSCLRRRLSDVSWFMGALLENISRRINREEDRKGTCWEGRFQCRVTGEDEEVMALVMLAHVDLEPVRCGAAATVEATERCSAGLRCKARQADLQGTPYKDTDYRSGRWLGALGTEREPGDDRTAFDVAAPAGVAAAMADTATMSAISVTDRRKAAGRSRWVPRCSRVADVPILRGSLDAYVALLGWLAGQLAGKEPVAIPEAAGSLLSDIGVSASRFVDAVRTYSREAGHVCGREPMMAKAAAAAQRKWFCGIRWCRKLFAAEVNVASS